MKKKPLIGVTLDSEQSGGYATVPWYALRKNYCDAIGTYGGIPLCLPYHHESINVYVDMIDGLVITGGGFDIPPEMYGHTDIHPTVKLNRPRTDFEFALTKACFEAGKPLLGICGGMQLINVVFGGTLIQDIPSLMDQCLEHKQKAPYDRTTHPIIIEPSSRFHSIIQQSEINVNSVHHQAIASVAPGFFVNATAPDGIIEGIEHPDAFCMGLQWHPEYETTSSDKKILGAFIQACQSASS